MPQNSNPNFFLSATGNDILKQIIFGEIPYHVHTVGILPGDNVERCERTEAYLRRGAYPFIQVQLNQGKADPFIIINIDEQAIREVVGDSSNSYLMGKVEHGKWIDFSRVVNGKTTEQNILMSTDDGLFKLNINNAGFRILLFDIAQTGIVVLRTNLDNPNKLSYTLAEIQKLNKTDALDYDIKEMQRLNAREPIEPSYASYIFRGKQLNMLNRLHATFADLN